MIDVLLVTTWGTACGIAEHSALLKEAVEAADPEIQLYPSDVALDPTHPFLRWDPPARVPDIVHLNYHAALHSRWTPGYIESVRKRAKVLVTYHDTGLPNSDQAKGICAAADAFVVHEPYMDLPGNGHYWRQGVPGWSGGFQFDPRGPLGYRPVVGTVGFPFPWKNYDLLCEAAARADWGVLLIAPQATEAQIARWQALNPALLVLADFLPRGTVAAWLAGCDATAFLYSCANTGTSGAIRQGIAARKPVLALSSCRQFRDLEGDRSGIPGCTEGSYIHAERAITWIYDGSVGGVAQALSQVRLQRVDPGIVALAHRDSWASLGARYAALYRSLLP